MFDLRKFLAEGQNSMLSKVVQRSDTAVEYSNELNDLLATPACIHMAIEAAIETVDKYLPDGFISVGSFGEVPQIAKREVNTAVLVDDGQTVVIGGVYEFKDQDAVRKVPFLGDLPIVGNFFRNKSRNKEKLELLIFMTPRILRVQQRMH